MQYLSIIQPTSMGDSAYSPDLLGCIATGANQAETQHNRQEASAFPVEGMQLEG